MRRNPRRDPRINRVQRILGLLSQLHGASEKQIESVPKNSILREFIGGSEFF